MTMVQSEEETEQSRANIAISTKTGIVRSRLTQLATIVDTQGWSVGDNIEGGGRFISATNATLDAQASRSEGKLVDMFGDLEEAFEEVSASAPTRATPEDFSDLAANLNDCLANNKKAKNTMAQPNAIKTKTHLREMAPPKISSANLLGY